MWKVVEVAAWAFVGSGLAAQGLVPQLRLAEEGARVEVALAAIDKPSAREVNGLLALIQAGQSGAAPAPAIGELAYAVVGWWSILDSGIANGLLDRFEQRDWPKIQQPLLELATLGATDGSKRASKWLASDDAARRLDGLRLLRRVGGDPAVIHGAIRQGLSSADPQAVAAGLDLVRDYVVASEGLRKQLEAKFAAMAAWPERLHVLWAMARGGAFRTDWMLARWREANANQRACIDYVLGQATTDVSLRLIRELPSLPDDAARQVVIDWLEPALSDSLVLHALLAASQRLGPMPQRMIDVALAREAPAAAELRSHWVERLSANDPSLQRVACQALARYGKGAADQVGRLIELLRKPQPKGSRLHGSVLLALAAIGPQAGRSQPVVKALRESPDDALADMAERTLARIGSVPDPMEGSLPFDPPRSPPPWRQKEHKVSVEEALLAWSSYEGARPEGVRPAPADSNPRVVVLKTPEAGAVLCVPRLLGSWLSELPPRNCSPVPSAVCKSWPRFYWLLTVDENDSIWRETMMQRWSTDLAWGCRALDRVVGRRKSLVPLLEWMMPRRPAAVRDWFAGWKPR